MLLVAGFLQIEPGRRDAFLAASQPAVLAARAAAGCRDFAVSADLVDADRVNIFESWDDRASLEHFRGEGPGDDLSGMIVRAVVREYRVEEGGG